MKNIKSINIIIPFITCLACIICSCGKDETPAIYGEWILKSEGAENCSNPSDEYSVEYSGTECDGSGPDFCEFQKIEITETTLTGFLTGHTPNGGIWRDTFSFPVSYADNILTACENPSDCVDYNTTIIGNVLTLRTNEVELDADCSYFAELQRIQ